MVPDRGFPEAIGNMNCGETIAAITRKAPKLASVFCLRSVFWGIPAAFTAFFFRCHFCEADFGS